jgi:glycosyltransferase involved in cell wall biosynthesis
VNTDSRLKNGFLVPVKNVSGLAESMEAYIQNTNLITQYGLNGRVYAEEKYDVNKINHDMLQILTPATKLRTTEKRISELQ